MLWLKRWNFIERARLERELWDAFEAKQNPEAKLAELQALLRDRPDDLDAKVALGAAIALPLLHFRLKLPGDDLVWLGALVALTVSSLSLALGARYLLHRLRLNPVKLLRGS